MRHTYRMLLDNDIAVDVASNNFVVIANIDVECNGNLR
jgi:hypothetical protein